MVGLRNLIYQKLKVFFRSFYTFIIFNILIIFKEIKNAMFSKARED